MKVSIVTISYNQVQFLEQAIRSVLEQDYPDIEYIVVDPGSTDGSRGIIEKYRGRISKIIYEPDRSPADGLNEGFSFATGDIYGFINSDDFLLPGSVSHVATYFSQNSFTDVVSGHAIVVDEFGKQLRKAYSDHFDLLGSAYGARILMQPSSFFLSGSYKKTNGFNIDNRSNWDDEFFVDIKLAGGIFKVTNKFLSAYRLHSSSITGGANENVNKRIQNYSKSRFRKIIGRDEKWYDYFIRFLYLITKYLKSPLSLYERAKYGTIYRRYYQG
jgi:glycosyltransferase involved in cell wall biosynthesis